MKLLYTLCLLLTFHFSSFSQITLLSQNFDTYDGDSANFIPGYYISWNSPASGMPSQSYYSSTGNFGLAPNSYKFGIDSATIITPFFSGADSLTFWFKGNNTGVAANVFYIYESADSITFNLLDSITLIPTVGMTYGHGLNANMHYLKFLYHKAIGNIAFDDLKVFNNQGVGISKNNFSSSLQVYPNPSNSGVFNFTNLSFSTERVELSVYNLLGENVLTSQLKNSKNQYSIDLSHLTSGSYFAVLSSGNRQEKVRLIIP
jgi:hypothetical protein